MRTDAIKTADMSTLFRLLMPSNALVVETALQTGLRVSDVLSLRSDKLRQRMTVREQKTGKSRRVYISADLLRRLQRQAGSVYVFPNVLDPFRHRCRQTVWKDMKRAAKALRVDYILAPHSCRKSFAVDLYRRKGFAAVQKALQHDNPATTMLYLASAVMS